MGSSFSSSRSASGEEEPGEGCPEGFGYVEGNGMFVYGNDKTVVGHDNLVIGDRFHVTGKGNMICGYDGKVVGDGNTVNGVNVTVQGKNNIVVGRDNRVSPRNREEHTAGIPPGVTLAQKHNVGITPREVTMNEIEKENYRLFGIQYMVRKYVTFPNRPTARDAEQDKRAAEGENECFVCKDNKACCVIVPCGHQCCATCAPKLENQCPLCRHIITGIYRIYES